MLSIHEGLYSFIQHYGGLGIFVSLVLEYIGLPIPGETGMSLLGYLSWKSGGYLVYKNIILAAAGTFSGSTFAYFIGFRYGENILIKYGKYVGITQQKLILASQSFDKHKTSLLLFSRYVPGLRHIVPYLSGIIKVKFDKFLKYNLMGSVLWCASFIGLGFMMGEKWKIIESLVKAYFVIALLLIVFIFIVVKHFKKYKVAIFSITFPLLLFIKLCEDLIKNELSVFDSTVYKYVSTFITEDLTDFMKFISFLGSGLALISIALISLLIFWKKNNYSFYSKMIAVNLLACSILNETFKLIFHRERPYILRLIEITGFSFPSGHSMIGISFYGLIVYLCLAKLKNRWKYVVAALFAILILLIGISRIYLGVHYASDILAGFFAGLAWLGVFITLINNTYIKNVA